MGLPVMQFPKVTFEEANPMLVGMSYGAQLAQQLLNNQEARNILRTQPQTLQEQLRAIQLSNQINATKAQYAPEMAEADLAGALLQNAAGQQSLDETRQTFPFVLKELQQEQELFPYKLHEAQLKAKYPRLGENSLIGKFQDLQYAKENIPGFNTPGGEGYEITPDQYQDLASGVGAAGGRAVFRPENIPQQLSQDAGVATPYKLSQALQLLSGQQQPTLRGQLTGLQTKPLSPYQQGLKALFGQEDKQQQKIDLMKSKIKEQALQKGSDQAFNDSVGAENTINNLNSFIASYEKADKAPGWAWEVARIGTPWMKDQVSKVHPEVAEALKWEKQLGSEKFNTMKNVRTQREFNYITSSMPNTSMPLSAAKSLTDKLSALAQRTKEYQEFHNQMINSGIDDQRIIDQQWERFSDENPIVNRNGEINRENISNWQDYLNPGYTKRGQAQTSSTQRNKPTLEQFVEAAKKIPSNKNKTDQQLIDFYNKKYGGM